ncbi:hypothetical protein JIQ42_02786 [Leishmania sp. Namibia]|uniref:hypothetical protein n=1 Tax=Leishmania sp. Namibia TaxID=2802991 RepID=UPI001B7B660E|nr:hypothetical protein JIQ42_02786 [Leishmania sp. Namibia]
MACVVPSLGDSHVLQDPGMPTSPVKIDTERPITAPSNLGAALILQASGETLCAFAGGPAATTPATHTAHAFSKKPPASTLSTIRRFVCRSSIMVPFMVERAAKEIVVLPPPIHYLYPQAGEARDSPRRRADRFATCSSSERVAENAKASQSRGDVFDFTWTTKQKKAMRMQQREHLRKQRCSPHAPVRVTIEGLTSNHLNDADMRQQEKTSSTVSNATAQTVCCDAASALSVLCTLGIPQAEYIRSVFQYRMSVFQKRIDAVPTGAVVPAVVQATATLDEVSESRRGKRFTKDTRRVVPCKKASPPTTAPTVTYPHPGMPFTYQDLVQHPLLLNAEQRANRRAALLHRRTLSEEVYGQPVPYA